MYACSEDGWHISREDAGKTLALILSGIHKPVPCVLTTAVAGVVKDAVPRLVAAASVWSEESDLASNISVHTQNPNAFFAGQLS